MIFGVCGGIAESFNISPLILRAIFFVLHLFLFLYIFYLLALP
ncbi:PspC domain-containing protein [Cytobacillus sp. S13-E01]|nr:PspC domain-containing protein [Cytobacillus sp. S13-E01]MDF0728410.1 PspC domain-containing protein [Cytobacillus sp. S13-E01]